MITNSDVEYVFQKLKLNPDVLSKQTLKKGMNVELEHGTIDPRTNVTNDNLIKTAKIALAHIIEFPDYYKRLDTMERDAKIYWRNKKKQRNIFL